jgi:hypothetical protein
MKNLSMYLLTVLLLLSTVVCTGCGESWISFNTSGIQVDPNDANIPMSRVEATGSAADTLAKQFSDNIKTEAARLADLFEYNSLLFLTLFLVMLGGVVFAVLTKSSWGWIIPTVAGAGLAALVFIVQAVQYIKWIGLGIVFVALGVLIYKTWEYQKERNKLIAATANQAVHIGEIKNG